MEGLGKTKNGLSQMYHMDNAGLGVGPDPSYYRASKAF